MTIKSTNMHNLLAALLAAVISAAAAAGMTFVQTFIPPKDTPAVVVAIFAAVRPFIYDQLKRYVAPNVASASPTIAIDAQKTSTP